MYVLYNLEYLLSLDALSFLKSIFYFPFREENSTNKNAPYFEYGETLCALIICYVCSSMAVCLTKKSRPFDKYIVL